MNLTTVFDPASGDTIYDLAEVMRSKNAGPLYLTFDMIFPDAPTYRRVLDSGVLTPELVSALYPVVASDVSIVSFDAANAIKITIPRTGPTSGAPGDRDVYGAQQHEPLIGIRIPPAR
ncbi:DUF4387 domain-containing protein [Paraburkholderia sp. BCC1886]|uniref:DUF4387 domain-containing protein n=1 Tax=Paraburkholderia sp. BCC1886 TaxID=2562670 RepID=UPI001182467D|nr:DUF4387 domain-containing protein [Paraburkholderia sp. BCC1886]